MNDNCTELIYLVDPTITQCEAKIIDTGVDEKGRYIVVDKSPFYPARGGQQSERGFIQSHDLIFEVFGARLHGAVVRHYGSYSKTDADFILNCNVLAKIDEAQRQYHSKIHSAGELLCAAVKQMGYANWVVTSAIHYEDRMSVEYNQMLPEHMREDFIKKLENTIAQLIEENLPVGIQMTDDINLVKQLCGYKPEYISDKEPIRLVNIAGNTRPCMGSHVLSTSQIGSVKITKIKSKKGQTTITYSVE